MDDFQMLEEIYVTSVSCQGGNETVCREGSPYHCTLVLQKIVLTSEYYALVFEVDHCLGVGYVKF